MTDSERQPLLQEPNQGERDIAIETEGVTKAKHEKTYWNRVRILLFGIGLIVVGLIFFVLVYVTRVVPNDESFKEYAGNITNVDVRDVSFDGWTHINKQRYYKIKLQSSVWLDYEAGSSISDSQKQIASFLGGKIAREVCFDLNKLDTYQQENDTTQISLGSIIIPETVCIDLRHNKTTDLDLLVLIKPNTDKLIPILKQIWEKKYEGLNIWSSVNLDLKKKIFSREFVLWKFNQVHLYWQDFGIWERLLTSLRHLSGNINDTVEQIEINDITLKEMKNGYEVYCSVGVPNPLPESHINLSPEVILAPQIQWYPTLPGCLKNEGIELGNVIISSPELDWNSMLSDFVNLTIKANLIGELPDDFLNHVCSSDDSNIITPMSKFLSNLLDPKSLIDMKIECSSLEKPSKSKAILEDYDIIRPFLDTSFSLNYTVNIDDIVQEVNTRGIKLEWSTDFLGRRRLNIKGKIVAKVQIPFYQVKEDTTLSMERIKGHTKLYHNEVHMLTVPLDYWTNCSSQVILDESDPTKSYFDVSFDIDNDQVIVEDTLELTHCINEIVFKGESLIFLKGKLDLMVTTSIGDIVLLKLPGEGSTIVRA